jgi:hypothetical protein
VLAEEMGKLIYEEAPQQGRRTRDESSHLLKAATKLVRLMKVTQNEGGLQLGRPCRG